MDGIFCSGLLKFWPNQSEIDQTLSEASKQVQSQVLNFFISEMASGKKKVLPRCVEFGPPELSPEEKKKAEKGFVLDGIAVATFSDECGHASPKLATAIPPYNAQNDSHAESYFKSKNVSKTLKKAGMV